MEIDKFPTSASWNVNEHREIDTLFQFLRISTLLKFSAVDLIVPVISIWYLNFSFSMRNALKSVSKFLIQMLSSLTWMVTGCSTHPPLSKQLRKQSCWVHCIASGRVNFIGQINFCCPRQIQFAIPKGKKKFKPSQ